MNDLWLPDGHHWDLHIEHRRSNNDAGEFTGGGKKFLIHTTQGGSLRSNSDLLHGTNTPHLLMGFDSGELHPTVIQFLPFDVAGKTLQNNTADGYQTNRANVIQMEIVGFTESIPQWSDIHYKRLANVLTLVQHRFEFPTSAPLPFKDSARMSDAEFVKAAGIYGHIHAPDNVHYDPRGLDGAKLVRFMKNIPSGGYDL